MAPKMEPKWSQNGSQTCLEAVLEGSRSLFKNRLKNESKIVDLGGHLGTLGAHMRTITPTCGASGFAHTLCRADPKGCYSM